MSNTLYTIDFTDYEWNEALFDYTVSSIPVQSSLPQERVNEALFFSVDSILDSTIPYLLILFFMMASLSTVHPSNGLKCFYFIFVCCANLPSIIDISVAFHNVFDINKKIKCGDPQLNIHTTFCPCHSPFKKQIFNPVVAVLKKADTFVHCLHKEHLLPYTALTSHDNIVKVEITGYTARSHL